MKKQIFIFTGIAILILIVFTGIYVFQQQQNIIKDPETGEEILADELIILASGQDVEALVAEFGGEITISVPKLDTYQARFPVDNLAELNEIMEKLNQRGVQAIYATTLKPLKPREPQ